MRGSFQGGPVVSKESTVFMDAAQAHQALVEELARRTHTKAADWYLVFKARYGLEEIFQAVKAVHGSGAVATQLFTCCTAVAPIVAAGLTPVYGDIEAATLALDPSRLPQPAMPLRAVVLQHTFGIIDNRSSAKLAERAHEAGALLVEDSAHCACRMALDEDGCPVADVSVHSFGAEKMLRTSFGGAVWINPRSPFKEVLEPLAASLSQLPPLAPKLEKATRRYLNQNRVLNRLPRSLARSLRASWAASGALEPAVAAAEQEGELPHRPMAPSPWICERVLSELSRLDENWQSREAVVARYCELFEGQVDYPAGQGATPAQPLLRFGLIAPSTSASEAAIAAVRSLGYLAEDWYRPSLYPGALDPLAFCVPQDPSTLPVCDAVTAGTIALPTELPLEALESVAQAVKGALKN